MRLPHVIERDRVQALASPGRVNDPGQSGRGVRGDRIQTPVYVTWSGATATVHKRLLLGVPGHGLGSELS